MGKMLYAVLSAYLITVPAVLNPPSTGLQAIVESVQPTPEVLPAVYSCEDTCRPLPVYQRV